MLNPIVAGATTVRAGSASEKGPFTLPHFRKWAHSLILDSGKPLVLEQFQESFIADLFAGRRENWLVVPEENAKTSLISVLALYHCKFRDYASVPIAASSREQVMVLFGQAEGFVTRSGLGGTFECLGGTREIRCAASNGRIKVHAADQRTGDGVIPTLAITEELHRHRDLGLYRTWRGKLGKRNGQIIAISTAGEPYSEFEEARDRMRQFGAEIQRSETFVRSASPEFVLHDWAVPEDGDVNDLALVKKANPLSAITIATLTEKRASPTFNQQHWNRMTCNRPTRASSAAIQESEWQRAQSADRIPEGQPVWLGLDVGWKTDTTAFVPLWVRDEKSRLLGPATVLVAPPDGTSLHPDTIKKAFREIRARNPIVTVVMDAFSSHDIKAWIESEGVPVQEHSQADAQSAIDYERFMEGIRNGELWHTGDRTLTRHAMNTAARIMPSGKVRFGRISREQRGPQRTMVNDALISAAMVNAAAVDGGDTEIWVASA